MKLVWNKTLQFNNESIVVDKKCKQRFLLKEIELRTLEEALLHGQTMLTVRRESFNKYPCCSLYEDTLLHVINGRDINKRSKINKNNNWPLGHHRGNEHAWLDIVGKKYYEI